MVIKKKKKGATGTSKPVAVSGSKGPGFKPKIFGNKGGAGGGDKYIFLNLPKGTEDLPVVPLEDIYTWFVIHEYKAAGDRFFSPDRMFISPRDEDDPESPSFVDEWIDQNPEKRKNLIGPVKTIAVTSVWVPEGVPGKENPDERYQVGGIKAVVLSKAALKSLDLEYKDARKAGKDLRGMKFAVSRSEEEMAPRCGDTWRYRGKRWNLEALEKKLKLPQEKWALDWKKLIPVMTKKRFKTLLEELTAGAAVSTDSEEDDIPF